MLLQKGLAIRCSWSVTESTGYALRFGPGFLASLPRGLGSAATDAAMFLQGEPA